MENTMRKEIIASKGNQLNKGLGGGRKFKNFTELEKAQIATAWIP